MSKESIIFLKLYFSLILISFVFTLAWNSFSETDTNPALRAKKVRGEKLFQVNCSSCHLNGQNSIRPSKPIIGSLKLKSKQAFKDWLENPIPPMPSFKNITSKPKQLNALYSYVVSLMSN